MVISSRTPEGEPVFCVVCGNAAAMEFSDAVDSLCPACGALVWRLREWIPQLPASLTSEHLTQPLSEQIDSMEFLELVMAWEESHPDLAALAQAGQVRTPAEILRWIREHGGPDSVSEASP